MFNIISNLGNVNKKHKDILLYTYSQGLEWKIVKMPNVGLSVEKMPCS